MTRTDEAPRERLAEAMEERRLQLGRTWDAIAAEAEVSPAHLRKFRRGQYNLGPLVGPRVEAAFGWKTGSFARIEAGLDPIPVHPEDVDETQTPSDQPESLAGGTTEPTWAEAMTSIERTMQTIAVAHQAIVERLESQDTRTSNRFEAIDDRLGSDADRLEAIESRLSALEGSQSMSSGRERRKGA